MIEVELGLQIPNQMFPKAFTEVPKMYLNSATLILNHREVQRVSRKKEIQVHLLQFSHFTDEKNILTGIIVMSTSF